MRPGHPVELDLAETVSIHGQWSSRLAFILAAVGSAVGLGNIWKFPYIAGANGGGAFVLVYLACILLVGLPIIQAEVLLGRLSRRSPVNTFRQLAAESGGSRLWPLVGFAGIAAGLIIISFYSVIAGWSLAYLVRMAAGVFRGVTAEGAGNIFGALIKDPERVLAWHTLFMLITCAVVARGVRSGLERAVRLMVPALLGLLLVMVAYAYDSGQFAEGWVFLFGLDFDSLTAGGVLIALGHAFFTLSLGMGAMMVYGSYLPAGVSIPRTVLSIAVIDTVVALLAGMAIFPIVFANGLSPASGPGLLFQTLPVAFGQMPAGVLFGSVFFLLLVLAAWTSAISLLEPAVAWLVENRGMERLRATVLSGAAGWLLGLLTVLSFSHWAFGFRFAGVQKSNGFFDMLDILSSSIMLPLGGLAVAWFTGWVMTRERVAEGLGGEGFWFRAWYNLLRVVTPLLVLAIFLNAIGVL